MLKKISARHFDLTDDIKEHAEAEMDVLTKYFENIISADLVLDIERHRRLAELNIKVYNQTITGTGESDDIYNSIGMACDKVKTQLKKYKSKLKDRKQEEITETIDNLTKPETDYEDME